MANFLSGYLVLFYFFENRVFLLFLFRSRVVESLSNCYLFQEFPDYLHFTLLEAMCKGLNFCSLKVEERK